MNERIEHITKQVDEYFDDLTIEFSREAWQAKFAELIVRECIELVEGYTKQRTHTTFYKAEEQIKQHFGVEE